MLRYTNFRHGSISSSLRRGHFRLRAETVGRGPYELLGISRNATRGEARAAYINKMKEVHPDVSIDDTTSLAASINAAYEQILQQISNGVESLWNEKDVFDEPNGFPGLIFINPFRCLNVNPLEWRGLQSIVKDCSTPEDALFRARVTFSDSAICYLTPDQMQVIEEEMQALEFTLDFQTCQWFLEDCLIRAERANSQIF